MAEPVLSVSDLRVRIGRREIVRGVSFDVERESTLGIVGESGSGKSMTVLAATGLLDAPGAVVSGSSTLAGDSATDTARRCIGAGAARSTRRSHRFRVPGSRDVTESAADC